MSVSGIGYHHYQNNTDAGRYHKDKAVFHPYRNDAQRWMDPQGRGQNASPQDIYEACKTRTSYAEYTISKEESEEEDKDEKQIDEQETDTEILVKPDGSKVMMTTIRVGGMETVMSMEIAKPTGIPEGNPSGTIDNPNMMITNANAAIETVPEK